MDILTLIKGIEATNRRFYLCAPSVPQYFAVLAAELRKLLSERK